MLIHICFLIKGAVSVLRQTLVENGFLGLFRGNSATMARIIPYASLQFTAHEQYKMLLRTDSKKGWVDFFYILYLLYYILIHLPQSGILKQRKGRKRKEKQCSWNGGGHIFSQNLYCSTKFVAFLKIPFSLAHIGILSHHVQILQLFKLMWLVVPRSQPRGCPGLTQMICLIYLA